MPRKSTKSKIVAFKVEEELAEFLNNLPNKSDFIRKAILAQFGMTCPLCVGSGVVSKGLHDHYKPILEAHTSNDAIVVGDGDLIIPSERITPLGLIIHEWMTNSMKYGSLSVENGKLNLSWSLNQQSNFPDEVSLSWIETLPQGLSVGNARPEKGFGSKLLNASVRQINGTLKTDFTPRGFEARLRFPV